MQSQHSTCISIRYDHILAAWREQVTAAANSPDIKHPILYQERELLPRFSAQYATLMALPTYAARDAAAVETIAGRGGAAAGAGSNASNGRHH
ncbi:MAG: hypothetical protein H0V34_05475 [Gammaproteobacteria bacterium]|nr:hypothetical protein [Gammaproteobacteria bacterium]